MNAQGGGGLDGVLQGVDDDLKSEDVSPDECGQNSMISCC